MPERKSRRKRTFKKEKKRTKTDVRIKVDALIAEGIWKRAFDSVPDLIVILDKEHRIVQANKSMAERLGTTPERCVGLNCFRCVHKLDAPPSFCPHSLTLADGKEHVAEIHEPNLSGDFQVSTTPLFDGEGKIIGSVQVARDITERKRAEEEIKSLSRFSSENPNVVMRISKDGNLLYSNKAGLLFSSEWKCQIGQPVPSKWRELIADVFKVEKKKDFEEKNDGQTFLITLAPFVEEGYVNVYGRDITERKQAEETVKAERKRFTDVLEMLPAYMVLMDPDYHVKYANKLFRERFGEDKGRRCFEYLFNRSEPCEICETYKTLKKMGSLEWDWTGPDGHNYHIFDSPFTDTDGSTLIMEVGIDITERKKAEEKLRELSLYSRRLIEASLDPLVTISAEGKITDVNKATEEATGFSREQLIGSDFSDYFTDPEEARKGYRRVFAEGFVRDYPLAIHHGSGKTMDVLYNATVYRNEAGEIQGVFAAARDITDRKKAEATVQTERKRLFDVMETVPSMIALLTPDYHVAFANRSFREHFGGSQGRHCYEYCFGQTKPCDFCEAYNVLKTGQPHHWEVTTPDGRIIDVHDFPFTDADGTRMILEMDIDITERRKAEEAVRKAHEELETRVDERTKDLKEVTWKLQAEITERKKAEKSLTESQIDLNRAQAVAKTGSWRLDVRDNVLLWSDETYRMFGITTGTPLTYETFLNSVHPEDREYVDEKWQAATTRGEPYDIEHRVVVDGKVKWMREKAELEFDKNGVFLGGFGTVQDITEIKEIQAKLERYSLHLEQLVDEKTQKLKEAERLIAIGETAGMVGHDIRNPLQSIEGSVYLAKEELEPLPDSPEKRELKQILEIIRHQTNYIDNIVADLQDFSRTPYPQLKETNIHELIMEAISTTEIPESIQIQRQIEDNIQTVTVDPVFVKRILTNLIENAVQAMPNGGQLTFEVFKQGECVGIHVEDTGKGILEEDKPKIFTPLFTTKAKGQGFGLAVCKKLVEAHNGEISFESEAGKGTTFKIKLPQRRETI